MTTPEYNPGDEDISIAILPHPRRKGFVALGIYRSDTGERLIGMALPSATARSVAENLTLASWKADEE